MWVVFSRLPYKTFSISQKKRWVSFCVSRQLSKNALKSSKYVKISSQVQCRISFEILNLGLSKDRFAPIVRRRPERCRQSRRTLFRWKLTICLCKTEQCQKGNQIHPFSDLCTSRWLISNRCGLQQKCSQGIQWDNSGKARKRSL